METIASAPRLAKWSTSTEQVPPRTLNPVVRFRTTQPKTTMPRLRYKHVFADCSDLIVAWRDGTIHEYGKTPRNRLNCDETTLYSYGKHFVASRKLTYPDFGDFFLDTERRYSNTTSRQLLSIKGILPRQRSLILPQLDDMRDYGDLSTLNLLADLVQKTNSQRICRFFRFLLRKRSFTSYLREHQIPLWFQNAKGQCASFNRVLSHEAFEIYRELLKHIQERTLRNAELAEFRRIKERMLSA